MSYTRKMRQSILFISIFAFCISCSTDKQSETKGKAQEYHEKLVLKPLNVKTFSLDATTSSSNSYSHYFKDQSNGSEYLMLLNRQTLNLYTFDWKTGESLSKIKLEREGPNGVGRPLTMVVKTLDSIYVLDPAHFRLALINSKGKVLKSYSLNENSATPKIGAGSMPSADVPIEIDKNHMYLGASPFEDWRVERYYSNGKLGLKLNLDTGELENLISFPHSFRDRFKDGKALTSQQARFGQTFNRETKQLIFNFMTENDVLVLNMKTGKISSFYAGSKLFNDISYPKIGILSNRDKEFVFFAEQPNFASIIYYPSKKVYFRYAAVPNQRRVNKIDQVSSEPYFHYSVIILDQNFNKVGETKLNSEHWWVKNSFVTNDGLYIKKEFDDESKLLYKRYDVSPVAVSN
jgi:hypothetical protein